MRKRELISILQNLKGFQKYDLQKEQYLIDAVVATDILYFIGFEAGELLDRVIFDLGCGPGRLIIGAVILGSITGVGVDIDEEALAICRQNARETGVWTQINLIHADVTSLPIRPITELPLEDRTIVMNPPFGKHARYADRQFLEAAFQIAKRVYSIHLSHPNTRIFLDKFVNALGFFIDAIYEYPLILEHTQDFHTHKRKKIYVDLYQFVKKKEK